MHIQENFELHDAGIKCNELKKLKRVVNINLYFLTHKKNIVIIVRFY